MCRSLNFSTFFPPFHLLFTFYCACFCHLILNLVYIDLTTLCFYFLPRPFVNLPGSLFSKESGRTRHTPKVSFIRVNMMSSCLALVTHKIYITPADLSLPDKTILLLSGWHISPISSAARTSQHSHFGAKIISLRMAFARWQNGEDNLLGLMVSETLARY